MGKPTICLGENKGADQLRSNCEADQRLCFRFTDSIIPLLFKFKISSLQPSSVTVQAGLCRTRSTPKLLVFSHTGCYVNGVQSSMSTIVLEVFCRIHSLAHLSCEAHYVRLYEPLHGKTNNLRMRKQRRSLCFRYTDSTIPLLSKSKISSL